MRCAAQATAERAEASVVADPGRAVGRSL